MFWRRGVDSPQFRAQDSSKGKMEQPASTTAHLCPVCNKNLSSGQALRDHLNSHGGLMPYRCRHCHRDFSWRTGCLQHEKTHGQRREYPCSVCHKVLKSAASLQKHNRLHNGNLLRCRVCNTTYTHESSYKRHMKQKHPHDWNDSSASSSRNNVQEKSSSSSSSGEREKQQPPQQQQQPPPQQPPPPPASTFSFLPPPRLDTIALAIAAINSPLIENLSTS